VAWIQHLGVVPSDIERSRRFYSTVLGLKIKREFTVPKEDIRKIFGIDSPASIISYELEKGQTLELFEFPDKKGTVKNESFNIGINHFALYVGDRKTFGKKLEDRGVETVFVDRGEKGFVYFAKDPDGILIELRD